MYADLYLDRIDISRYQCLRNDSRYRKLLDDIASADSFLPEIPVPEIPTPVATGVIDIGEPSEDSPVLVTGNSLYTHEVIGVVLVNAGIDCYLVSTDTEGYTVDMAVYLGLFRADRVRTEIVNLEDKVKHETLIIPGFAASLREDIEHETGWNVHVGPVCGVELPIYLYAGGFITADD